jgi:predicted RNA binding protein YcfA (HicA-like mRNA interferase family)
MSKLPITDARGLEKIILKLGFKLMRQKGSHRFYRHIDGRYTTIPHHGNMDLGRPLIREILKQVEISPEEYQEMLGL